MLRETEPGRLRLYRPSLMQPRLLSRHPVFEEYVEALKCMQLITLYFHALQWLSLYKILDTLYLNGDFIRNRYETLHSILHVRQNRSVHDFLKVYSDTIQRFKKLKSLILESNSNNPTSQAYNSSCFNVFQNSPKAGLE